MLSGGVDSTAALWHALNNTTAQQKIHVHHIHLQNIEMRWEVEAMAVNAIYEYLRKHSPVSFTSSESVINTPSFGNDFLWDSEAIGFMTGYITSRDATINKLVLGVTGSDLSTHNPHETKAEERTKAAHNSFHPGADDHIDSIIDLPLIGLTKQQAYDSIPPDLALLTWSCRTPAYANGKFLECGQCKSCRGELQNLSRVSRELLNKRRPR